MYNARKAIKRAKKVNVQVDLTKHNLKLLEQVRELGESTKEVSKFEFAFANVNCDLLMRVDGRFVRFSSLEEAENILKPSEADE